MVDKVPLHTEVALNELEPNKTVKNITKSLTKLKHPKSISLFY